MQDTVDEKEGLFKEQLSRKPNNYPWTDDFINAMWSGFWTPNEFNFKADYGQFHSEMTSEEQEIIVRTLSAIGQIEVAVKTFWAKLGENFPHPSMSDLGFVMANSEVIHSKAYEKLLETLGLNDVFEENLKNPIVKGRVDYLRKYLKKVYKDHRKQYIYAIILFTLFVENVSLFSQFYVVMWFNRHKNILKDTAQQISYTRQEEDIHSKIGIKLINTLREEYPELFDQELIDRVYNETQVAFKAESKVIHWILGDYKDENISTEILENYIKGRLDDSLKAIGFEPQFNEEKLSETLWMDEEVLGNNMVDFFHSRPTDYAKKNKVYNEEDLF